MSKSRVKLFGQHDVLLGTLPTRPSLTCRTTTWALRYFQNALGLAGLDAKSHCGDALYRILRSGNAITLDDEPNKKIIRATILGCVVDKHHRQQLGRSFRCLLGAP
ncbi:hypothetical protein ACVFZR_07570 [Lacticaseibacillus paracasei]